MFQIDCIVKALFISCRQYQIIWKLFKSSGHFEYHPNTLWLSGDFPDYFDTLQALVHCLALRLVTSSEGGGDTEEDKKKVSIMMLMWCDVIVIIVVIVMIIRMIIPIWRLPMWHSRPRTRATMSSIIDYCVTRAPLLYFIRSWVALSFRVWVSQKGIGNTWPDLHVVQYLKA